MMAMLGLAVGRGRSRLFEFWTGNGRLPLGGVEAIEPKPRIQVMVSQEKQYVAAARMV
jgi:hypothetical protein